MGTRFYNPVVYSCHLPDWRISEPPGGVIICTFPDEYSDPYEVKWLPNILPICEAVGEY